MVGEESAGHSVLFNHDLPHTFVRYLSDAFVRNLLHAATRKTICRCGDAKHFILL